MVRPRLRQFTATPHHDAGLRGRLEEFGLATVLSFLDLERRSGQVLVVADDEKGKLGGMCTMGRVWLRAGQAIAARIEGSRSVNRAALYELLSWERGCFAFTQEDLEGVEDEIGAPTAMLLMDAALRSDEAAAPAY